jgi:subtilisin-like proprotein convertase family protein
MDGFGRAEKEPHMQRFRLPLFLLSILLLLSPLAAVAQEESTGVDAPSELAQTMSALAAEPALLLFKAGVFDPVKGVPLDSGFALSDFRDRSAGSLIYVVQFPCVPGDKERAILQRHGAEILYYIPNNAYLVRMDASRFGDVEFAPEVRSAFRLPKFAKVDPALTSGPGPDPTVELVCTPGVSGTPVAVRLAKGFPSVHFVTQEIHHKGGRVVCTVPVQNLSAFLDEASGLEDVLSILPWEEKVLLNNNSVWVIQNYNTTNGPTEAGSLPSNYPLSATIWNHGITGTGQIACVNDSGAVNTSCFFRYNGTSGSEATAQSITPPATGTIDLTKKTIAYYVEPGAAAYDTSSAQYHGTHTCGSVLGDNYATLSTPTTGGHDSGDGMAPNAKLVMQDVGDAAGALSGLQGDLNDMFLQAYNAGARIHSDSWGTTASNYDATAMDMDEFTYRYEDFLFVVAMGNSGTAPGDGTIGAPATAKDVVSVMATTNGSSNNANTLSDYSRGPVDDGRRKPDVCTPGMGITSAYTGTCATQSLSGTSMATPTTSGGLVLLRQYFTDGWYPTGTKTAADARNPSAALMKACLVNGAMEVTGTDPLGTLTRIPSMDQGWGRTHLENALYFSGDTRRTRVWDVRNANGLTTGQQVEYTVNVTANTQPLKVHLVWTDPESTTLAATNLVNNMDLEVVSPSATLYRGNVFATGQSTTGGTADVLNNVEGFVLNSPATGNWTIRVKATAIPGTGSAPYSNRQGYALVATWATCTSTLAAPTGLSATDNGTTGINLSWNTVSGATGYIVYKAVGSSPAAGDYSVLVQQAGTTFTDTKVQGGYTYWYKVRATDNCSESPLSSAVSATYTGNCALYPAFGGLTSVTNDTGTVVCDLLLAWSAATSNCPSATGITYNIYRGTTPYFTPGAGNLIAHGVAVTSYRDYSVVGFTTYYYVVRAEDATTLNGGPHNGGNEDTNTVMVMGTPWASTTVAGTFTDDGGDANAKLTLDSPWRVSNRQNHTTGGSLCYHSAQDGLTYPAGLCVAATTPPLPLQAGAQLSYWVRYDIEYQWDGVVVEISTNGGANWTVLTPTPAYPTTLSQTEGNACNYPSTQGAFSGPSTNGTLTAWTQYSHDLSTYSGLTALVRWNLSADGGAEFEGFYLDDIQVTNVLVNEGCATRDGIVALDASFYNCSADTIGIQLADYDLRNAGTHAVSIASTTEPAGETVTLTESPAGSGAFGGSITTTAVAPPSPGLLSVANGDTITVTYIDADDGHGGTNVTKTDTAAADCIIPVISNVLVVDITHNSARVTWTTNEVANSRVTFGTSIPPGTNQDDLSTFVTSHSLTLTGLSPCTTYFISVTSEDRAGNTATDTNGGVYYSFETPQLSQPTYDSTDVPKTIADSSTVTSTLAVADNKVIQDVNVTIGNITHTYDGDLEIRLTAPDATVVLLVDNRGGTGENFVDTVFDDEAAASITSGAAPFTGSFRPEGSLAVLDGKNAAGTWTLSVTDTAGGDTGTLTEWSITFTYPAQACGPSLEYQSSSFTDDCSGGGAGDGDNYIDPGEDVALQLTLHNNGTSGTTGVSATISTATPGITITDNGAAFPNIAADGTGASQANHFAFSVGTGVACGTVITFNLHMVSNEEPAGWDDTFTLTVGSVVPGGTITDFSQNFTTISPPALPAGWTTSSTSGNNWQSTNSYYCTAAGGMYYPYNGSAAANSWAYTPGVALAVGTTYTLAFNQKVQSATFPETFEVKCGTGATPAGQTVTILASATYTNTTCTARNPTFTVPTSGTYYIGFHCTSAADMYYLIIDDIVLTHTSAPSCTVNACTPSVPPGETAPGDTPATAQSWTNKTTHNWPSTSGATSYKVYRGIQGQLANLLNSGTDSCVKYDGAATSCTVNDDPSGVAGRFYWYLVTASNGNGEGTAGNHTSGAGGPRVVNSTGNCP